MCRRLCCCRRACAYGSVEVVRDIQFEEFWVRDAAEDLGMGAVGGQVFEQVGFEGVDGGEVNRRIGWVGG